METLIDLVRLRAADPRRATDGSDVIKPGVGQPATAEQISQAEQALDRALPEFLVQLYQEVGNGGFGPDYGLLGIAGGKRDDLGNDAVAAYLDFRRQDPNDAHWDWPLSLLPICHCGCGMYLCVDWSTPKGSMVWFEPNPHEDGEPWDTSFIPLSCDIQELFAAWVKGRSWWDEFAPQDDAS